ncbi:TPX2 protein family [Quillaja saponaria]|uniref:TPX2 protein family n=1 Tax=Quillaja saponaria TaxID=32244 RepID=A0AAD7QHC9_QUISA|nr:TPX2 protein family [Quillaja saponaria]
MMTKIPKFKARPLNKKILQAPTLPALPRSTPQQPEFREFHLETMARTHQNAESASIASKEVSHMDNQRKPHLTEPKTPVLHTLLRTRPPQMRSSLELQQEELEKIPKFKARPLNKKMFESRGELGMFSNAKKHVTIPQEFHFATNERIPPPATVADLFDIVVIQIKTLSLNSEPRQDNPIPKNTTPNPFNLHTDLSLNSEPWQDNPIPKNTTPNPFNLHTDERGAKKEKKFFMEIMEKQLEEERARVPKAKSYPYTTDYPVIPPKPEPKQCTKPEPFQLEIPEKVRKPLTQVEQFNLHVRHRAVDRAQFDQKNFSPIKEKETMYKRYREKSEAARMEEEKALKQLRRTMVPHARPVPKFDHPFC